jgi:hypothetical protein
MLLLLLLLLLLPVPQVVFDPAHDNSRVALISGNDSSCSSG